MAEVGLIEVLVYEGGAPFIAPQHNQKTWDNSVAALMRGSKPRVHEMALEGQSISHSVS